MGRPVAAEKITLEADEIQELSHLVLEALTRGDARESVIADLSQNGISDEEAEELVSLVEFQMYVEANPTEQGSESDGASWLIWVGIIIGLKKLSHFFN